MLGCSVVWVGVRIASQASRFDGAFCHALVDLLAGGPWHGNFLFVLYTALAYLAVFIGLVVLLKAAHSFYQVTHDFILRTVSSLRTSSPRLVMVQLWLRCSSIRPWASASLRALRRRSGRHEVLGRLSEFS